MRLSELHPQFVGAGGDREGVGLIFDCPCGCRTLAYVGFRNPIDGGEPFEDGHPTWLREGDTFDNLSLSPSIHRRRACGWHGWIRNGEVLQC